MKKLITIFLLVLNFNLFAQNEEFKAMFKGDEHVLSLINSLGLPEDPSLEKKIARKLNVDWKIDKESFVDMPSMRHQIKINSSNNTLSISEGKYLRYSYSDWKRVDDKMQILEGERLWLSKSKIDELRANGNYKVGQTVPLESFTGVLKSNDFVFVIKVYTDALYADEYYLVSEIEALYHNPTALQLIAQFDRTDVLYDQIRELCAASTPIDTENLPIITSETPKVSMNKQVTHYGKMIWRGMLSEEGLPNGFGELTIFNLSDCNVKNTALSMSENKVEDLYAKNGVFYSKKDFMAKLYKEQPYQISGFNFPIIPKDFDYFCYENCNEKYDKVFHFGGFVLIGAVDAGYPKVGYVIPTNEANYDKITIANFKTWGEYYRMGFTDRQFNYAMVIPKNGEPSYRIDREEDGIRLNHYPINEKREIFFYGKIDSLGRKQGDSRLAISNGYSKDIFYVIYAKFINDTVHVDQARMEKVSAQKLNFRDFTFRTDFDKPETIIDINNYFNIVTAARSISSESSSSKSLTSTSSSEKQLSLREVNVDPESQRRFNIVVEEYRKHENTKQHFILYAGPIKGFHAIKGVYGMMHISVFNFDISNGVYRIRMDRELKGPDGRGRNSAIDNFELKNAGDIFYVDQKSIDYSFYRREVDNTAELTFSNSIWGWGDDSGDIFIIVAIQ